MLKSKAEPVKTKFSDSPWKIPIILGIVAIGVATAYYFGLIKLPSFGQSNNFYEIEQQATVGVPYSANFAKSLIPLLDPNYNGDSSMYTFSLGSGTGFPPIGLVLSPDGTLSGTPTGQSSTFQVCVKDASGKSACKTYHLNVNAKTNTNNNNNVQSGDSFAGEWVTQSPGTYYLRNDDGSRYGEITANFDITVRKVTNPGYNGYTCGGTINVVSKKEYGEISVMILGDNPIQFNSAYTDDTAQVSGNKLITEHRGLGPNGKQVIILELVNSNTLQVTMSVIPWDADHAGGYETDTPIILVRK